MIFDQQVPQLTNEALTYLDWVFGDVAKQPDHMKESEYIRGEGSTGSRVIRIKGNSDTVS